MSAPSGGPPPPGQSTQLSKSTQLGSLAGRTQGHQSAAASSAAANNHQFTPQMRDRQARGKNPYRTGDSSDASASDGESRPSSKLRLGKGR